MFGALWRRLAHGQDPPSAFRLAAGPLRRRHGRGERTRRALLIGGKSIAPNSIAAGIDKDTDTMVVHELVVNEGEAAK